MQDNVKVALFDFCETLANFQTADEFVRYVREQTKDKTMLRKERIRLFLRKYKVETLATLFLWHLSFNKRLVLWQLKGYSEHQIENYAEEYYNKVVRPNLINETIEELKKLQSDGYEICIVSAGYEIYLKHFCREFNIPLRNLIAVKIKFVAGRCKGCFEGGDRLWDKTEKLDERYDRDLVESIAYSDSKTDLPLLKWAKVGVVVCRKDKKSWAKEYNFKEILW